ncbi:MULTISPECIES: ligand-binding sensor domain-containing protein [Niastella]|uniref:histidine kinase n=1 Tax=Niastella soli TaxID=2821487 RepID=A0ABS3Z103_9BACT|nr:two-component regulator propeller domain-containing protein [Niastella soli]MBO9203849.1 hypothetical protein [Niastella soli]
MNIISALIYKAVFPILLVLSVLAGNGQTNYFKHYQVENGLSNNSVLCSIQDKMGFMWFGTKDGLSRFDGHYFKVFRKTNKPGSIGNNFVHAIQEDAAGNLWLGTERGVYKYTNLTETFSVIKGTENTGVSEIICDTKGDCWFTAGAGLMHYKRATQTLRVFEPGTYFEATGVCETPDHNIWISTAKGQLKRYDALKDTFATFDLFKENEAVTSRWIERITALDDGRILAGTSVAGVKIFDTRTGKCAGINIDKKQKDLFIRNFLQTSANECWIGTEYGVYILNWQTGESINLSKKYNDPYAISDNAVYAFCKDREGGIWVGTYFGGVNYYPPKTTPFKRYFPRIGENSLSGNVVREIKGDKLGNLWIGTEDAGLNYLDKKTGLYKHPKTSYPNIHGLLVTDSEIWIGTFEHGLDVMDANTHTLIRHYDMGPQTGLNSDFIYCIGQTKTGAILIGTTIGIYSYDRAANRFHPLPSMPLYNWYTSMLEDSRGIIWAGTYGNGIHYLDRKTNEYRTFRNNPLQPASLKSDRINAIFESSRKEIWIATDEGLSRWNAHTNTFLHYTTSDGLPGNYIINILEDHEKNLWVTTTQGLAKMDRHTGAFQVFTLAHGLLTDQFNFSSAYKDSAGIMYFGSAKGMISFQPADFYRSDYIPPLFITGFQVNNEELDISDKKGVIDRSISHTATITLAHNQSTFSIDFAALSFTAPEMQEYAYQLVGVDKQWTHMKGNRRIYYTDLSPGNYVFKVKAASSSGNWNALEKRLKIEIRRPWWTSAPAYLSYCLLVILGIMHVIKSYNRWQAEKNKRRLELLQIAREKEILQAKIEFFTNVAHEIKTPLTLIKVPLAKVIKKTKGVIPEVENSLRIMDKNTNRLLELTQQLLDFRQTEINQFRLSFVRTNISELVEDANKSFSSLAEQNNITLLLNLPAAPVYAYVDAEAFNKIIYNLYSNAIKYAGTRAIISVLPTTNEDTLFFVLFKNDGHLIPEYLQSKIFQPFYRIRKTDHQPGTGIGLALALSLTELHRGTLALKPSLNNMNIFELGLPIHQDFEFNLKNTPYI